MLGMRSQVIQRSLPGHHQLLLTLARQCPLQDLQAAWLWLGPLHMQLYKLRQWEQQPDLVPS